MATVYFTNNADSGDGSLRAAIAAANPGDVITYDDTAFASDYTVAISLSSLLQFTKEVTIDGRAKRIVLDGQGASRIASLSASVVLKQLDIIRGYSTSSSSGGVHATGGTSVLEKCRLCGCYSGFYGSAAYILGGSITFRDCIIAGNRTSGVQLTSAAIRTYTSCSATLVRCTAIGNTQRALSAATAGSITVQDSLVQGVENVAGVTSITPSSAGFVTPCPDTIDASTWSTDLWRTWDFRLKPTSPYLTGAAYQSGDKDLLGHDRTGSWGCFDGSWLVVGASGAETVASDAAVDWLEVASTGVLTLSGADRILTVSRGVFVETGAAITSSSRGYVVAPSASDCDAATLTNVVCCVSGADVLDVSATINEDLATITVTKTQDKAVVVEGSNDGGVSWSPCVLVENSTTLPSAKAYKFRAFDGEKFVETQVIPRTYYYVSQLPEGDFAEPSDWSLDKAGTKVCTDAPTIADGTFDCR